MRSVRMAFGALLLVGVFAAVAAAQGSPPTVAVTAGKGTITAQPPGPIASGPTTFAITRSGKQDVSFYLATLRPGYTVEQLQSVIKSDAALGLVYIEASADLAGSTTTRSVTVTLRPSLTYVLISQVNNTYAVSPLATDATANGAQAPAPAATISMFDYGFRGATTLPRNGVIRVRNDGSAFHFALAFPVRKNASKQQIARAFRTGNEKAIGRIVAGAPVSVQGVLSPTTINDSAVKFPKAGRYTLVCFFGNHNALGMYRTVNVR